MSAVAEEVRAGRELDAVIAERVMGWTRWADLSQDCPCEPGVTYFADWGGGHALAVYTPEGDWGDPAFHFRPSEDISAAWEVVNEIIGRTKPLRPWGDSFRHFEVSYLSDGWRARIHENHWNWPFGPKDEPGLDVEVEGEVSAPLAICRAALKAVQATSQGVGSGAAGAPTKGENL